MLISTFEPEDPLSPEAQERMDEICDSFEADWNSGQIREVSSLLSLVESAHRPRLLAELLRQALALSRRDGRPVDLASFKSQLPEYANVIEAVRLTEERNLAETVDLSSAANTDGSRATEANSLPVGTPLGPYCLLNFIGGGAFGHVYLALHLELQQEVAIKISRAERSTLEQHEQFRREARLLARLDHPHILRVRDSGVCGHQYYVVSDLARGMSLQTALQSAPLDPERAALLVAEVADALGYCHRRQVIHRDVKPENILLDYQGRALLADFGIALSPAEFTWQRCAVGTPRYMSPEQVRGRSGTVDGRSDIFSLGVVLFRCVTGTIPYRSRTPEDLVREIQEIPAPPLRTLRAEIPTELEAICLRCLAKSPEDRFATAEDLAAALRAWQSKAAGRSPRKFLIGIAAASLILVALLAGAILTGFGRDPGKPIQPLTSAEPKLETVEFFVQRDPKNSKFESYLLVENGDDRAIEPSTPLDRDDQFVLFYRFDRPVPWTLIQVDPAGAAAVVAKSDEPASEVRIPTAKSDAVSFKPDDPRGVNLLLLVVGEDEAKAEILPTDALAVLAQGLTELPVRWSQLRSGLQAKQIAAQLPRDYLRDIDQRLPSGWKSRHALFLRTE